MNYKKLKDYYYLILTEAYEQQNAFQHAGYECEKAVIKLSHTLHQLVIRFRMLFLEETKTSEESCFTQILEQLREKGNQLLSI